jgi:hypothetical protein
LLHFSKLRQSRADDRIQSCPSLLKESQIYQLQWDVTEADASCGVFPGCWSVSADIRLQMIQKESRGCQGTRRITTQPVLGGAAQAPDSLGTWGIPVRVVFSSFEPQWRVSPNVDSFNDGGRSCIFRFPVWMRGVPYRKGLREACASSSTFPDSSRHRCALE